MKITNQNTKYFSFRSYLLAKYDGLIDKDTPSKRELAEIKRAIPLLHGKERREKERELIKKEKEYNKVMKEWLRQQ